MKKIILFLSFAIINCSFSQTQNDLMPIPESINYNNEKYIIDENFGVDCDQRSSKKIHSAVVRMFDRLVGRTGLFLTNDYKYYRKDKNSKFKIIVERDGLLNLGEDESYKLQIKNDSILLSAVTDLGIMHGLETLLQLIESDKNGYYFKGCTIIDKPRFIWRGLMIDVSRHFMPLEVLFRNIDAMASVKLNVLHLHLSENQGFRVECKSFPKLHELGSDGFYYTQNQIKEIISFANDRGIRVVPEFDMPAHSTSWFVGYPELASLKGPYKIERSWGVFNPVMNPTKEYTYDFLDKFFAEMTQLFNDEYFHIGGDENTGKDWDSNPEIAKFKIDKKIESNHSLQNYFIQRVSDLLTKYNKKIIGWEEILQEGTLKSTVLQTWREEKSLINALNKGYKTLVSRGYYIDLMYSTENHYLNDPFPINIKLNDEQKKLILGGETTMWSEFVTAENIDSRIWPRVAAIAERFWSRQEIIDVDDMYRRLEKINFQLEEVGLLHIKNREMMIRRIVNYGDETSVRNLLDVVEPLEEYNRFDKGKEFTSYSSYSRLMDVATPEAKLKRPVQKLIEKYLLDKDKNLYDSLKNIFLIWKNNHNKFLVTSENSPILKEVDLLSFYFSKVGEIALELLEAHYLNKSINKNTILSFKKELKKAKEQKGQCEIVVIDSIEKLF